MAPGHRVKRVRELVRSSNPVFVSWLEATLRAHGVESFVLDQNMSIMEGSIGILPRRVMVVDEDLERAEAILKKAQQEFGEIG